MWDLKLFFVLRLWCCFQQYCYTVNPHRVWTPPPTAQSSGGLLYLTTYLIFHLQFQGNPLCNGIVTLLSTFPSLLEVPTFPSAPQVKWRFLLELLLLICNNHEDYSCLPLEMSASISQMSESGWPERVHPEYFQDFLSGSTFLLEFTMETGICISSC